MEFSPAAFRRAFSEAPRPSREEFGFHRHDECEECAEVVADLSRYAADEIPNDVIDYYATDLSLLSAAAWRYLLPRFVRWTAEDPDSNASEFVLYNLCPDDPDSEYWSGRCDAYTRIECEAIVSYLQHRRSWPDAEFDEEWIGPAIEFWTALARTR
jgi:hypothetical protein